MSFLTKAEPFIKGRVQDKVSRHPLKGAYVSLLGHTSYAITDSAGTYKLSVPKTVPYTLIITHVGYSSVRLTRQPSETDPMLVELRPGLDLSEVTVRSVRAEDRLSDAPQMSQLRLSAATIREVPALFGEKDALKIFQLLPGVQKGSEGSAGLFVRGGNTDQNLILLDDATVYNPNHLLGFFSVFNGDILKSVELTKGGFPARFGGRLSSMIEAETKEGDAKQWHGSGSLGLISSRATVEGPLQRGRSSFLLSGRRTYVDLLTKAMPQSNRAATMLNGYHFYDLNGKISLTLSPKDRLHLSGYFGRDRFQAQDNETLQAFRNDMNWGNAAASLRWSHWASERFSSRTALTFSNYRFGTEVQQQVYDPMTDADGSYLLRYVSAIRDFGLKHEMTLKPSVKHELTLGGQLTHQRFAPSAGVTGAADKAAPSVEQPIVMTAVAASLYADDLWRPGERWMVRPGVRMTAYVTEGITYWMPEPRLSVAYRLPADWSIKAAYARMNQALHLLSSSGSGLPTDLWVPSTRYIRPQQSDQATLGLTKDIRQGAVTISVENYYKSLKNLVQYREGSSFPTGSSSGNAGPGWEQSVTTGRGESYGSELLVRKNTGRLTGWIGYTLSWTRWQFEALNFGKPFYPRNDRRHDLSVVGIYRVSPRVTLSASWVYATGQAVTLPTARFRAYEHLPESAELKGRPAALFGYGRQANDYGSRNSFRTEPYHRLDLSAQFRRTRKWGESTWEVGLYNAYNRLNTFYYRVDYTAAQKDVPEQATLRRYTLFPVLPSVSYTFKF